VVVRESIANPLVAQDPTVVPGKTQTILIVDDTQENILLLSEVLESDYMTKAAIDGERALKIAFAAEPPDLILLDVMMPGMSGYEVCKRLKENPNTSHIPVIFVTAMGEVEDETKGLELGAVDYITKPISPPIVMARVKTHLERYEQKRELQQMVVKLEEQARELEAWNQKLEQRVAEGVAQLDRLGRMKRFFSPAVADLILAGNADDPLKTHRREIVVVFLDMRGFTTFSESADPEEVMSVLAEYHAAMGELITKHAGTLERFTGDGIMIFFNDPVPVPNPARQAVSMALEMQQRFKGLAAAWARRGYELSLGIGIAQGYATIGAIGFEGRRDYGAIGNVTNLAARLCGEAQGGQILVSQRVEGALGDVAKSQPIGDVSLKGFNKPIKAFEICWNI